MTYFLFPSEDAINVSELKELPLEKLHLLFLMVAGIKQKKFISEKINLKNIPCVKLDEKKTIYLIIIVENNQNQTFLCTYESMGKVIETLEGDSQ